MKIIKSIILFCLWNAIPILGIYFLLDGTYRIVAILAWIFTYLQIFRFADKCLLYNLKAREIIESDQENFFQSLKNETFKKFEFVPTVYVYSGTTSRAFVLSSGGKNWSLLVDRKLLNNLSDDQQMASAFTELIVKIKKSKHCWIQTKGIGLIAVIIAVINFTSQFFRFANGNNFLQKLFYAICLIIAWPFLECIYRLTIFNDKIESSDFLKPIYYSELRAGKTSLLEAILINTKEQGHIIPALGVIELYSCFDQLTFRDSYDEVSS